MRLPHLRLLVARLLEWRHLLRLLCFQFWKRWRVLGRRQDVLIWRAHGSASTPMALAAWIARFDTPSAADLSAIIATTPQRAVKLLVCLDGEADTALERLRSALAELIGLNWNAVLVGPDGARADRLPGVLRCFGHQARFGFDTTALAGGPVVVLLPGTLPRPYGPRLLIDALVVRPGVSLAYGDEVMLAADDTLSQLWCKPEWSPLLAERGGLPGGMFALAELHPAQVADPVAAALLQVARVEATQVVRIPNLLSFSHFAHSASPRAALSPAAAPSCTPRVSILIPTRNRWDLLSACLDSIARSEWPATHLEVLVIDNGSQDPVTLAGLKQAQRDGRIRVLRDDRDFNYARLNNRAAHAATGELLILLNNDTEVRDRAWIRKLAAMALCPGIGAVGPKLLYADATVQHAGIVLGVRGLAVHVHAGISADAPGYHGLARTDHEVAAVTGACLAVRREVYHAAGGLDEHLPVTFNDVEFCLKLLRRGLRNVYLADALVIHHESKSRGMTLDRGRRELALAAARKVWCRHHQLMAADPCYSPCLSLEKAYEPAFVPRRMPAWRRDSASSPTILLLGALDDVNAAPSRLLRMHATTLLEQGFRVVVGGDRRPKADLYPGCCCLELHDARAATTVAIESGVVAMVVYSSPFYGVARHAGLATMILACDFGAEVDSRSAPRLIARPREAERIQSLAMCTQVMTVEPDRPPPTGAQLLEMLNRCGVPHSTPAQQ